MDLRGRKRKRRHTRAVVWLNSAVIASRHSTLHSRIAAADSIWIAAELRGDEMSSLGEWI